MSGYGSMPEQAGVTGRADWEARQERRKMETLETADEAKTIRKYLAFG
eukprot:CAMPEP_0114169916 /NCGR_PEP_ID=MMETSP0043_2-20121206/33842_1 /TAXON_ID=464988 /ORGANISM="Hemiselmis andersenii, Strain CCMP644" /LENGTH=47 /DNA_ID= /DNA_START= /DNA_END= /DNA_ORIENTATION=